MSKKLINRAEDVVVESLQGLVACHPYLHMLDGLPDVSSCKSERNQLEVRCRRMNFAVHLTEMFAIPARLRA